jgi:hypothetical protein
MTPLVAAALTLPVLGGAAIAVLFLLVVAADSVEALDTIVHESAHMVVGFLTGRRVKHFAIQPDGNAFTEYEPSPWGPARILSAMAGYPAPRSSASVERRSWLPAGRGRCSGRRSSCSFSHGSRRWAS